MPATQRTTAEEYLAIPYSPERRWRQLIEGELVVDNPLLLHQALKGELDYGLRSWVRSGDRRGLVSAPIDVKLDEHNVFGPDLSPLLEGFALPLHELFPE